MGGGSAGGLQAAEVTAAVVAASANSPGTSSRRLRWIVVIPAFGLLALIAHAPTLNGFFVSDDFEELLGASGLGGQLTTDTHPGRNLRPVNQWLHARTIEWFDRAPTPQHLLSLLLHVVNAALVVVVASALARRAGIGAGIDGGGARRTAVTPLGVVAGALFLVHPSHTEAVSWISARSDLLMALGLLAALACWFAPVGRPATAAIGACVGFAWALGSKEPAVAFPVLVAGLEIMLTEAEAAGRHPVRLPRSLRELGARLRPGLAAWPLFAMLVPYLLARWLVLGTVKSGSWWGEFVGDSPGLVAARAVKLTLRTALPAMPGWAWCAGLGAAVFVVGAAVNARRAGRRLSPGLRRVAVLAFGGAAVVLVQYAPVARLGASLVHSGGERFTYFPAVIMCIVASVLVLEIWPSQPRRWFLIVGVAALLLIPAQMRWRDSAGLSRDLVASQADMVRDLPIIVLNLPDLMRGSLLGRNALGHDLEFIHGWRGPTPVQAITTYDAGGPGNRIDLTIDGASVRIVLREPGAKLLSSAGPTLSWDVPGALAIQNDPRTVTITFDAAIRRIDRNGEAVWPTVWVADGRRYRQVPIVLERVVESGR